MKETQESGYGPFGDVLAEIQTVQAELANGPQLDIASLQRHLGNTVLAFAISAVRELVTALSYHEQRISGIEQSIEQSSAIEELEGMVQSLIEAGEALLGALAKGDEVEIGEAKAELTEVILDIRSTEQVSGGGNEEKDATQSSA